jgi:flagellar L-ring protein precursor FlgH
VGDTLTVVLDELTRASKDGGTNANRSSANGLSGGAELVVRDTVRGVQGPNSQSQIFRGGLDGRADTRFNSSGNSRAANQFSGTITVTVIEVLTNGNLRVAGEKKLAVGAEEEVIRFGGVVSPTNIVRNSVLSSRVADARIEYRGSGDTDLVKRPGWLTRQLLRASPL